MTFHPNKSTRRWSIARNGNPGDVALMFRSVLAQQDWSPERRAEMLSELVEATRASRLRPGGDLHELVAVVTSRDPSLAVAGMRAVGAWRVESARPELTAAAMAPETSHAVRGAAAEALARLGGPNSTETLRELSRTTHPVEDRIVGVEALTIVDLRSAAAAAAELLGDSRPASIRNRSCGRS